MNVSAEKQQLRNQMRARRRALNPEEREEYARAATAILSDWLSSEHVPVGLYLAFDGELDPQGMIQYCWANNYPVYLPIVSPGVSELVFALYTPETELIKNHYGILQPPVENTVRVSTLQTLLMPLTAFDTTGARLGMGGGYYDRTLAEAATKPRLIGLAYDFQQLDSCPSEAHDEPLDGILTNKQLLLF